MNGISVLGSNLTLFLTETPGRKNLAFCFQDGGTWYPVAYVNKKHEARAREYWQRFLDSMDGKK